MEAGTKFQACSASFQAMSFTFWLFASSTDLFSSPFSFSFLLSILFPLSKASSSDLYRTSFFSEIRRRRRELFPRSLYCCCCSGLFPHHKKLLLSLIIGPSSFFSPSHSPALPASRPCPSHFVRSFVLAAVVGQSSEMRDVSVCVTNYKRDNKTAAAAAAAVHWQRRSQKWGTYKESERGTQEKQPKMKSHSRHASEKVHLLSIT